MRASATSLGGRTSGTRSAGRSRTIPSVSCSDLSRLSFIDAGGIHVVLELAHRSKTRHLHLVICPGSPAVQHAFEVCQLTEALPFITAPSPLQEPRDPVWATNGDARSGGALPPHPQRGPSPTPTRRPAPPALRF
ncbi:MAG TPA: STAS domain-containing protein [Solirubrobacteraceae bacterium]